MWHTPHPTHSLSLSLSLTLSGLQELRLDQPNWVTAGAGEVVAASDEAGARGLLAALQHLTQLRHLQLSNCHLQEVGARGGLAQPQQLEQQQQGDSGYKCFSALTASARLTALHLSERISNPLPAGPAAFTHMFPPGKVLPELQALSLCHDRTWCNAPPTLQATSVGAAQVALIAGSCPALRQLELWGVTPAEGFDASCLAQLPPAVTSVEGLAWSRPAP